MMNIYTIFHEMDFSSLVLIERDNDDNKFVDCAIASGALFIVSNDHHYDILETISFPKVDVIKIQQFVEFLQHQ